ncbi:MAG TPA: lysine--tRNA ligase [Polyangiales bacterium]|nr:lysine--tRNA ligase [Polyangiales bacterium]
MASEEELIAARRKHAAELAAAGTQAFPSVALNDDARRREVVAIANDAARCAALPGEGELPADAESYPLYGRVMAKRGPFLVIQTPYGNAQALVRPENLPPADAAQYEALDLADHVRVEGPMLRTRTGALTIKAQRYAHLAKALLPPPAKWHGFSDVEKRYRERYVDLFANPEVAEVFRARGLITSVMRQFLIAQGFFDVETPILNSIAGGATAKPFETHHNALDIPLFLRIAPELYLKRLLVGGLERVFEIGRLFRNEGVSTRHNPEFTTLEAYMAYGTWESWIELLQGMLREIDRQLSAALPRFDSQRTTDFQAPWARVTLREALGDRLERAGTGEVNKTRWSEVLTREVVFEPARLAQAVESMLPKLEPAVRDALSEARTYGAQIYALFELLVEPELTRLYRTADGSKALPVFITEFPVENSPLARKNDRDPRWVDRFELYVDGREAANAFSELNDPDDQAERFREQLARREHGDEEAMAFDHDYIRALLHGMPPAGGIGVGLDRLVMSLCGQASIRDVLLFPLLKPEPR